MKTVWFHCFSGIAGDMALGSLVDAGADLGEVVTLLDRLPFGGWQVEAEPVLRGGIAGTKIHVRHRDDGPSRTASQVEELVRAGGLPDRVESRALAVFRALAEAEGRLHRRPPEEVHFHEVGGVDAIIDVVGTCAALEVLGVDRVTCSPVAVGLGMVRAEHGVIPNPAPATVDLLRGLPTRGVDIALEITTPTGAAIVAALTDAHGPMPEMEILATGFGAGTRELPDRPNLTQAVLGETLAVEPSGQPVLLLEANLDDATGEVLAHAVAALLDAGAHDAWITPIVMKKGRPAHTVSALCDPALGDQITAVLTAETGTFGVRGARLQRWPLSRSTGGVEVDGRRVRVKVGPGRAKAEFEDAAAVARTTGRPVRDVLDEAERTWHTEEPAEPLEEPVVAPAEPIREVIQEPDRPFAHHHHHDGHHDHGVHEHEHEHEHGGHGHEHGHDGHEDDPHGDAP